MVFHLVLDDNWLANYVRHVVNCTMAVLESQVIALLASGDWFFSEMALFKTFFSKHFPFYWFSNCVIWVDIRVFLVVVKVDFWWLQPVELWPRVYVLRELSLLDEERLVGIIRLLESTQLGIIVVILRYFFSTVKHSLSFKNTSLSSGLVLIVA